MGDLPADRVSAVGGPVAKDISGHLVVRSLGTSRKVPFTIPAGTSSIEVASVRKKVKYYR